MIPYVSLHTPHSSSFPSYYLDAQQQVAESDCKLCTAGMYCPNTGAEFPQGNCSDGYYCPGGQNTSTPHQYKYVSSNFVPLIHTYFLVVW